MDTITKAKQFASHAHRNHFRSDKKTPYIFHLEEVAKLVEESGGTQQEIAAAWLHDTVEDTATTIEDIRSEFGDEIGNIVQGLTDLPEWLSLPLHERKNKQSERIANESDSVKRVKLADQTSNVKIVGFGKDRFTLDEKLVYIDGAKQIAERCKSVSTYLDALFAERYEAARINITTALQE